MPGAARPSRQTRSAAEEIEGARSAPARKGGTPANVENHPPSPLAGEGGGEGGPGGVEAARSAKSSDAQLRSRPARLYTVPPHPTPLPPRERGPETARHSTRQSAKRT